MLKLILIIFSTGYIGFIQSDCSYESTRLYCTNLVKTNNSGALILETKDKNPNSDVTTAYLSATFGKINNETFSLFPKLQSLDIQFSSIDEFSAESTTLDTLYIINNSKFPKLTEGLLKKCCKQFKILFIVNNTGMEIEEGAFNYLENLTHLTISKQHITHITKGFLNGLQNLSYLNLEQNGINTIHEGALDDLTNLNHLALSNNNFNSIPPKIFENLKVLETLELYGLKLDEFNTTIFSKQKELKHLGLATTLIKKQLELLDLTKTFPKLETIGVQAEDKEDPDITDFVKKCKADGFMIKFSNTNVL